MLLLLNGCAVEQTLQILREWQQFTVEQRRTLSVTPCLSSSISGDPGWRPQSRSSAKKERPRSTWVVFLDTQKIIMLNLGKEGGSLWPKFPGKSLELLTTKQLLSGLPPPPGLTPARHLQHQPTLSSHHPGQISVNHQTWRAGEQESGRLFLSPLITKQKTLRVPPAPQCPHPKQSQEEAMVLVWTCRDSKLFNPALLVPHTPVKTTCLIAQRRRNSR